MWSMRVRRRTDPTHRLQPSPSKDHSEPAPLSSPPRPANGLPCPAGDSIWRVIVDTHSKLAPNLAVCRALLT
jgi:hypothetical protein